MRYVALILLVLLAACGTQQPEGAVLSGSEGVVLTVIDYPRQVFENEQFPITFEVENRGITEVSELNPGMFVHSIDNLYFEDVDLVSATGSQMFALAPRDQFRDGEKTFFTLFLNAREIQQNSEVKRSPVFLSMCYPYQSQITTEVCIEQVRRADPGAVVCQNQPVRPQTPGAPIGVSLIETRSIILPDGEGVAPTFRLTIRNLGRGIPGAAESCDLADDKQLNQVFVFADLLGETLDCGVQPIRLINGESTVTCRMTEGELLTRGEANFLTLLNVQLEYTYRESEQVEVMITR